MPDLNPNPHGHPTCEVCGAFAPPRFHVPEQVPARVQGADGSVETRMVETTAYGDRRGICRRYPVAVPKDLSDWCSEHRPVTAHGREKNP